MLSFYGAPSVDQCWLLFGERPFDGRARARGKGASLESCISSASCFHLVGWAQHVCCVCSSIFDSVRINGPEPHFSQTKTSISHVSAPPAVVGVATGSCAVDSAGVCKAIAGIYSGGLHIDSACCSEARKWDFSLECGFSQSFLVFVWLLLLQVSFLQLLDNLLPISMILGPMKLPWSRGYRWKSISFEMKACSVKWFSVFCVCIGINLQKSVHCYHRGFSCCLITGPPSDANQSPQA